MPKSDTFIRLQIQFQNSIIDTQHCKLTLSDQALQWPFMLNLVSVALKIAEFSVSRQADGHGSIESARDPKQ